MWRIPLNLMIKGGYGKKDPPLGLKRSKYTLDPVGLKHSWHTVPEFKVDKILCLTEATNSDPINLMISVSEDKMSILSSKVTRPDLFFNFSLKKLRTPRKWG